MLAGRREALNSGSGDDVFAARSMFEVARIVGDKLRAVRETRAEVCVAADNSCLMHIGGALHRQRAGIRTMHIAEILATTEGDA